MRKISTYLLLVVILTTPLVSIAADVNEPCTGTAGASLVGNSGGSGFGEVWQDDAAADFTTENGGVDGTACSSVQDASDDRNFTAGLTNFSGSFSEKHVNTLNSFQVRFESTADVERFYFNFVRVGVDSSVRITGATSETIGTWSALGFKLLEFEGGDTGGSGICAANEVRARFDGGAYSACIGFTNAGTIDQLDLNDNGDVSGNGTLMDSLVITDTDLAGGSSQPDRTSSLTGAFFGGF